MDMMDYFVVIRVNNKKTDLNNYSEQLFFLSSYKNIILIFTLVRRA